MTAWKILDSSWVSSTSRRFSFLCCPALCWLYFPAKRGDLLGVSGVDVLGSLLDFESDPNAAAKESSAVPSWSISVWRAVEVWTYKCIFIFHIMRKQPSKIFLIFAMTLFETTVVNLVVIDALGPESIKRWNLVSIGNPIVEIRLSHDRLISTMGSHILVR